MPSRSGRRRWIVGAITVVVVAAVGVTAWATTSGSGTAYRTALVRRGAVDQSLTTTGVLSPVRSADADFQVAGAVARVRTAVGHQVAAGQVLAHLDRSSLRAALTAAQAALTNARSRRSEDESGEVSAATDAVDSTSTSTSARFEVARPTVVTSATPRPSGSPRSGQSSRSVSPAQLERDQAAVVAAQRATDRDLTAAKTALATTTTACAAQVGSGSTTTTSTASGISCAAATAGLLHDQNVVNVDETTVDRAEQTLSADLSAALKSLERSQKSASSSSGSHHTSQSSSSSHPSVTTVSAADLATDQASIDQARASVASAKADLRQATLTASIAGTVTAVTISKGDSVSAGSDSASPEIEIVGSRQDEATVYVSASQVRTVALGMRASVTPDGASHALAGRVVGIGSTGTEASTGAVSYPVTIDITAPATDLVAGADAAVSITLATASNVLAVPTSAVHHQGSTSYVEVVAHGKSTRRTVKLGAVGPALTQVTSGLNAGQRVILADLKAAVPSSSTTLGRVGGGFGGGGGVVRFSRGNGTGTGFQVSPATP